MPPNIVLNTKRTNELINISFVLLMQVQFVMAGYHSFQLYLVDCDYPRLFIWWVGLQQTMFLGLFCDFYRKTYNQRREPVKDQ